MGSINESKRPQSKEKWPVSFDLEGVPRHSYDSQPIREQLLDSIRQREGIVVQNFFAGERSFDLSKPKTKPVPFQEFPKMLHHPIAKDPGWLKEKARIELYNQLHPEKPELLPYVPHLTVIVQNKEEQAVQMAKGYELTPPVDKKTDELGEELPPTMCGRGCGRTTHPGRCRAAGQVSA